jgi:hypothetical protein
MKTIIFWTLAQITTIWLFSWLFSYHVGIILLAIFIGLDIFQYFLPLYKKRISTGFSIFPMRKIYTDFGVYYIHLSKSESGIYFSLYKENFPIFTQIVYSHYDGFDEMKTTINAELEYRCSKPNAFNYKDIKDKIFKEWNGSFSKNYDRCEAIKKIIK